MSMPGRNRAFHPAAKALEKKTGSFSIWVLQLSEWPCVPARHWNCGLGVGLWRAHTRGLNGPSSRFSIYCQRVCNMSNAPVCRAKPVNICPCSTYKIVLLSGCSLSLSLSSSPLPLSDIPSLFHGVSVAITFHSSTFISSIFYFPPLCLFIFSPLSLRGQERCARLSWQQRWGDKMEESLLAWPPLRERILGLRTPDVISKILLENNIFLRLERWGNALFFNTCIFTHANTSECRCSAKQNPFLCHFPVL